MVKDLTLFSIFSKAALVVSIIAAFSIHPAYAQKKSIELVTSPQTAEQAANDLENRDGPPASVSVGSHNGSEEINTHSVGLGVGQTFLNSDFDKLADSSITADLYYNYAASYSFDFLANFHYAKQDKDSTEVKTLGFAPGIKAKLYQFDAFAPFAIGGVGFYHPKVKRNINGNMTESEGKWVFGYHFGAGCELRLNHMFSVGIIFHFHNPFDVKQGNDPKVQGSYHKLMATAFYTF